MSCNVKRQHSPPKCRDLQDGEHGVRVSLFLFPIRWSECPPTRILSGSQSHDNPTSSSFLIAIEKAGPRYSQVRLMRSYPTQP